MSREMRHPAIPRFVPVRPPWPGRRQGDSDGLPWIKHQCCCCCLQTGRAVTQRERSGVFVSHSGDKQRAFRKWVCFGQVYRKHRDTTLTSGLYSCLMCPKYESIKHFKKNIQREAFIKSHVRWLTGAESILWGTWRSGPDVMAEVADIFMIYKCERPTSTVISLVMLLAWLPHISVLISS